MIVLIIRLTADQPKCAARTDIVAGECNRLGRFANGAVIMELQ